MGRLVGRAERRRGCSPGRNSRISAPREPPLEQSQRNIVTGFRYSMSQSLQFETPENVQVQYTPAGLGTRFCAWVIDQFILAFLMIGVFIVLMIVGFAFEETIRDWVREMADEDEPDPETFVAIVVGIGLVIQGLSGFLYFTLQELFWRGQSFGKARLKIRVVKVDGFGLDPVSIFVRNLFRVADNIPLLWIVPVMSARSQRLGDMVGGTVVISEEQPELGAVRTELSDRKALEAEFRFDARMLSALKDTDFEAVERLLDRWSVLRESQRESLLESLVPPLARKMNIEAPPADRRVRFLEDLLAAELRRQGRMMS